MSQVLERVSPGEALEVKPIRVLNQIGLDLTDAVGLLPRAVFRSASREEAPWQVGDATILVTGPSAAWRQAPATPPEGWPFNLEWVQIASSGVDGFPAWLFDVPEVTTGRGVTAEAIADYVLAAILDDVKNLSSRQAHGPEDYASADAVKPLGTLDGKVLGLAGFGAIGGAVARRAEAFGLKLRVCRKSRQAELPGIASVDSLPDLLAASDIVVLALPLDNETRHCVDRRALSHAKPGLHLINVARGGLIDQEALIEALSSGIVRLATLDVTEPEPLPAGHAFYSHPSIRLTPHIAWSGGQGRERLAALIAGNIRNFLVGEPLVNRIESPSKIADPLRV